jgi:zinc protease
VLGDPEDVQDITREDIRAFYKSLVKSNHAVLAVFGDIDPDTVVSQVGKAFGDLEPGILHKPSIAEETRNIDKDEQFVVENEKTSAAIMVGYNGLTLYDADAPVVDVLDAIISGIGYPSGWLHEALRGGERSLVYFVHAYPVFGIDAGYFGIMTQTTMENYDAVMAIIREKMDRIQEKEVDEETFRRAKNMCITMHRLGLETITSQASSAALNELVGLGYHWDQMYPSRIQAVTRADVLRVAKNLFSNALVVTTKPSLTR